MNINRKKFRNISKLIIGTLIALVIGMPFIISLLVVFTKLYLYIFSFLDTQALFFIDTQNYVIELKDIIYFSFTLVSVTVTGIFSYYIWKANKASAVVSGRLSHLEEQRDISVRKENATILYYSGLSGLELVFNLYRREKINKPAYLSDDWTKNLASLNSFFSSEEIRIFYEFYSQLLEIRRLSMLEIDRKNLYIQIENLLRNLSDESCLEYCNLEFDNKKPQYTSPLAILNLKYRNLFIKLERLFVEKNLKQDRMFNDKNWLSLKGIFDNNTFVSGQRFEYYSNGNIFCTLTYENKIVVKKQFMNLKNEPLENCTYVDGKASGFKRIYRNGKLNFEGEIKEGKKYNGMGYNFLLRNSDDYDYFREQAWLEQMEELANDKDYQEQEIIACEENSDSWEDLCQVKYKDGQFLILEGTAHREYNY